MKKAEKLYLGNVITMDKENPRAEAVAVAEGCVLFVGGADEARTWCDEATEVIDLGENTIYPGFMEAHCHPMAGGGMRSTDWQATLDKVSTLPEYLQVIKNFVGEHPDRSSYRGGGYVKAAGMDLTAAQLDEICADKPIFIIALDGHSLWLNTRGMEVLGIGKATVEQFGEGLVPVDEQGNPIGFLGEAPAMMVMKYLPVDLPDLKTFLKIWEQFAFSKGYTACYDAGHQVINSRTLEAYVALANENNLKLRTYTGSVIDEFCEDIPAAVANIVHEQEEYNSEYFKVIGVKMFSDGVVEAHTAYLLEDYADRPGFKGVPRFADEERLLQLYGAAHDHNLSVHVHAIGDASVRCCLDAIQKVQEEKGAKDLRHALAHLQVVDAADVPRFAQLGVGAVVAPLWAPKDPVAYELESNNLGPQRAEECYRLKDFYDAGVNTAFHTDFPVSHHIDVPRSVYDAVVRNTPGGAPEQMRGPEQAITRYQALEGMTVNPAYMWHEEDRLGSLAAGKIANMTVYDRDFLEDDLMEVANSSLVCTVVDGDIVYQA